MPKLGCQCRHVLLSNGNAPRITQVTSSSLIIKNRPIGRAHFNNIFYLTRFEDITLSIHSNIKTTSDMFYFFFFKFLISKCSLPQRSCPHQSKSGFSEGIFLTLPCIFINAFVPRPLNWVLPKDRRHFYFILHGSLVPNTMPQIKTT